MIEDSRLLRWFDENKIPYCLSNLPSKEAVSLLGTVFYVEYANIHMVGSMQYRLSKHPGKQYWIHYIEPMKNDGYSFRMVYSFKDL